MLAALGAAGTVSAGDKVAVVGVYPHDPSAFTQGLVWDRGALVESTGRYGLSEIRVVDLSTGRPSMSRNLPDTSFGEGAAVIGDRIFQLTWREGRCRVYDRDTLELEKEISYPGEGWGLTSDGGFLVMSDGGPDLRWVDPVTFQAFRTLTVTDGGRPVENLNELEMVNGMILANVWQTDRIARIDPATGQVASWIDLSGLLPEEDRPGTDVLNGIAYDQAGGRLLVTGKLWPKLFHIRIDGGF